jgi:hypothetical protein
VTPQALTIIKEIAALRGVDPRDITRPCRRKKVFRARIEVAKLLDARGYSTTRIGHILRHDHTTIVFYLGRGKKQPSVPVWRKPKIRTLRVIVPPKPAPQVRQLYLKPYAGADMREYCWQRRDITNIEERP